MICKNCNSEISEEDGYCPVCNVYINVAQVATREVRLRQTYILILESGQKFDIVADGSRQITVGRADVATHPDIDLGPYDDGPYISRRHGAFFEQNGLLYYTSTGRNGTKINDKKCGDKPVPISAGDKIKFAGVRGRIAASDEV